METITLDNINTFTPSQVAAWRLSKLIQEYIFERMEGIELDLMHVVSSDDEMFRATKMAAYEELLLLKNLIEPAEMAEIDWGVK